MAVLSEGPRADLADVWFLARVDPPVLLQGGLKPEQACLLSHCNAQETLSRWD